jgi:hypothetical protein
MGPNEKGVRANCTVLIQHRAGIRRSGPIGQSALWQVLNVSLIGIRRSVEHKDGIGGIQTADLLPYPTFARNL